MKEKKGFTLIEVMIVIGLVSLLAAISVINLLAGRKAVEINICTSNRTVIEHGESEYYHYSKKHSKSLYDLFDAGYLSKIPVCPSGGVYAWVPYNSKDPMYQTEIGCSLHTASEDGLSWGQISRAINQKYSDLYQDELAKIKAKYKQLEDQIKQDKSSNWKQLLKENTNLRKAEENILKNQINQQKSAELDQAKQDYNR